MKPTVYLTRRIPQEGIDILRRQGYKLLINPLDKPVPRQTLLGEVSNADALLCMLADRIDRRVIDAGKRLKVISAYAVGIDNIDVSYATKKGIIVTNTPGVLTEATAELTWALLFACARRVTEADRYTRAGRFKVWGPTLLLGRQIGGKTIGIIGAGRIGQSVGRKASAFGMNVLYFNRSKEPQFKKEAAAQRVDLKTLLKKSDFITLHLPLTKETRYFITLKELRQMKRTAYLINVARGPVVKEADLVYALKHNLIAGAGLDVYEHEPKVHPALLKLDNITLLPHLGSATVESRIRMAEIAAKNITAALHGKQPLFRVK
ncbi:MAG: D-glycerate dehydrogenase [Planctomycetota bacterium]